MTEETWMATVVEEQPPRPGDRHADGRFAPGNQVARGHGRPSRAHEVQYLTALREVLDVDKWKQIIAALINHAIKGSVPAAKFLADYLIGKPILYVKTEIITEPMTRGEWLERADNRLAQVEALQEEADGEEGIAGD